MPRLSDPRPDAFLWDLDTTLADTTHRRPLLAKVKAGEATWEDYSLAAERDVPREAARVLMQRLSRPDVQQIVVSGRSHVAEGLTWRWIHNHGFPVTMLKLRPEGDYSSNGDFKVGVITQLMDRVRPVMFFEDWAPASKAIREGTGIPVLTINPEYGDMCTCGFIDDDRSG